jgi:hypothetical protein
MATSNNNESATKQNPLYECKVFQCPRQRDKLQKNSINSNHDRMIYRNVLHSECNSLHVSVTHCIYKLSINVVQLIS